MNRAPLSQPELLKLVLGRLALLIPLLGASVLSAGRDAELLQAWLYLATLLLPMCGVLLYLLKRDPPCWSAACACAKSKPPRS